MMLDESPVHAAVRRARMERARARGEAHLYDPSLLADRAPAPYVPYNAGVSGGRASSTARYPQYAGAAAAARDERGAAGESRLLASDATAVVPSQYGASAGGTGAGTMLQVQGMQLSSLQRETDASRRAVHSEVEAVKVRVVDLEERVQEVEGAVRDAIGRCASEMSVISAALAARRSGSNGAERDALLGERALNGEARGVRHETGGPPALKNGAYARPLPPPGASAGRLFQSPTPVTPAGAGAGVAPEPGTPAPALAEEEADARALLRGFARGRVVWHNNWLRDFGWYVRCNTPVVAAFASHPCSPYRRWHFSLVTLARFGLLSWFVYNGTSGRPYGVWINETVSRWTTRTGRWPDGLDTEAQLASLPQLFRADRTMVAIHFGVFFAVVYQLLLLHLAVPPRFLPTRPEMFLVLALGGVSCLGVMISEATADRADGGIVVLLLLYAEFIYQVAALIVDLIGFQVLSSVQMQMLLNRQLAHARARERAGADPERALSATPAGGGGGGGGGADADERARRGGDGADEVDADGDGDDNDDDDGGADGEPLTGPDRAHPSARCCSANSLYAKAYPFDLRYPRGAYLRASWRLQPGDVAALLAAKESTDAAAHGRTPETSKAPGKRGGGGGGVDAADGARGPPKRMSVLDMAAEYVLEHSAHGRERAARARGASK
ncbi:hypothetical protein KFE25_006755 [Diacronema lutheri]|uniref:Uncharacterized protein n=2 Tax=Diacronema lutheri TaxID=2081491 RepID=A0A8J5XHV4_DIALT|nr:hypothetical protein KFE25_006755 [Diacronema lutheri]